MLYAALPVLVFLFVRFGVTAWNYWARPALRHVERYPRRKVSVLIPARDEAANIGPTLQALAEQGYPLHEVVVLDDGSQDETAHIVSQWAEKHPFIRLTTGEPLPAGWLGKNWACHQLGQAASGEVLLFIDADVEALPGLLPAALAERERQGLALLSIFPDQVFGTAGERTVVPIMHYLLLTMLPLSLVRRLPYPSLAAANGQFMLFEGAAYRETRPHSAVRQKVTEDIETVKYLKNKGLRCAVHLGGGLVRCRMYDGYRSAIDGFGKNLLAGFGSVAGLAVYLYLSVFGYVFVGMSLPVWGTLGVLGVILVMNGMLARLSRRPLAETTLLHPLKMAALTHVALVSMYRTLTATNQWKGRTIGSP